MNSIVECNEGDKVLFNKIKKSKVVRDKGTVVKIQSHCVNVVDSSKIVNCVPHRFIMQVLESDS